MGLFSRPYNFTSCNIKYTLPGSEFTVRTYMTVKLFSFELIEKNHIKYTYD